MQWAATFLCFCGFFRSGELTIQAEGDFDKIHHNISALDRLENPTTLRVRLKASKMDPFIVGIDVFVGRSGYALCPVVGAMVD